VQRPLTTDEQQRLLLLVHEAKSRGLKLDEELVNPNKKDMKWPIASNNYFLRNDGKLYNPSPNHEGFIKSTARNVLLFGPRGCGKALSINTPIPTPDGWKAMADIRVGDFVFDEFGNSVEVVQVSDFMFNHVCYDVVFDDDSVITADAEHIWTTLDAKNRSNRDSGGKLRIKRGKLVFRSKSYWQYSNVTTEEIKNTLHTGYRNDVNHSVDVAGPLNLEEKSLSIPPYVLGLWLGDGTSAGSSITIGEQDIHEQEIILSKFGIHLTSYGNIQYGMNLNGVQSVLRNSKTGQLESNPDSLFSKLKKYDLIKNKHIPLEYLRSSYQQRLELLQGLMDSDGTIRPDGACEYCTVSSKLAHDFYELCMTLGIKVSMKEGIVRFNGKDIGRFRFVFVPYIPVFKLSRKLNRVKKRGNQSERRFRRYIVDIRKTDSVPVKCIAVNSQRHLYLAGRSFIPTHNSGAGSQKALFKIMQGQDGIVMNPDFENLKISTWPEFRAWIPWEMVIPSQRHRANPAWQPHQPFALVFRNGVTVYVKGGRQSSSSRGPNVNWFWYDEGGRDETGETWQITNAGVRVGHDPQAWCTETPRPIEHWSYRFFIDKQIPEDLIEEFQKVTGGDRILVESFHATRDDNKANLDATYYLNLSLNYPSGYLRAQEFEGDFANEGGKIGDRKWFNGKVVNDPPENVLKRVRFWDLAATEKKFTKDDPDESVGSLLSKKDLPNEEGRNVPNFYIEHQVSGYWEWDALLDAIANTARHDGRDVVVVLEEEPGSGGKNQVAAVQTYFKKQPDLQDFKVVGQRARDVGDRVMAANHWFAVASRGNMWLVRGNWNEKFLAQLDGFTQILHDDHVTSVTGAMTYLNPFKTWARVPFMKI